MVKNGLIEKKYLVFPFMYDQCTDFNMFLKTEDEELTQRILYNFARGARITKEYVLCENWGYVGFASHPLFLTGIMHKLDKIEAITEKELYQIRSTPDRKEKELYQIRSTPDRERFFAKPPEFAYFDVDEQTLHYPHHVYEEKIKEKLEHDN